MEQAASSRLIRAAGAAFILLVTLLGPLASTASGGATITTAARAVAMDASTCGKPDSGVFGLVEDSVDPEPHAEFRVAGRTYASADFDRATLAVFELAWLGAEDVCIDVDSSGKPVSANATADICGDALIGATVWIFRTGTGALDANGKSDERQGFIDDSLMGFHYLSLGGDPTPPNFLTSLKVATDYTEPDDCIAASVTWSSPDDPVVKVILATSECLVADAIDDRVATFIQPANNTPYAFNLTSGSSVSAVFEHGELGGLQVRSEPGLDGAVTLEPIDIDGCPDANLDAPDAPVAVRSAAPSNSSSSPVSATAVASAAATVAPSTAGAASASPPGPSGFPIASPPQSPGAAAAPIVTATSADPAAPSAVGSTSSPPIGALLIVAAFATAAAGGLIWQFALRRRPAFDHIAPSVEGAYDEPVADAEPIAAAPAALALERVGLTTREGQVLAMLAGGMSNREIGSALFITESTAGVHVSNILGKLGVGSRTDAARYAIAAGVEPSSAIGPVH
jgi:DNA-binding CsgD family transcriptional regulator